VTNPLIQLNRHGRWLAIIASLCSAYCLQAFEGRIQTIITQGNEKASILYTVSANYVRIENADTNLPLAKNIISLDTQTLTLIYPHNHSFVRLKSATNPAKSPPEFPPVPEGTPPMPNPNLWPKPSGPSPATIGPPPLPNLPSNLPAMPSMPAGIGPLAKSGGTMAMPRSPTMAGPKEDLELTDSGVTTNYLGYDCTRFELKQRGFSMELWATKDLLPYYPWRQNPPPAIVPNLTEQQWPGLLRARGLFPLRASLKQDNGTEQMRFEVQFIRKEQITDPDGQWFQPPGDYHEIEPPPF
jgi:hypothetical protein